MLLLCFGQYQASLRPSLYVQLNARLRFLHDIRMDKGQREQLGQFLSALGCRRCTPCATQCHLLVVDGKRCLPITGYKRTRKPVDEILQIARIAYLFNYPFSSYITALLYLVMLYEKVSVWPLVLLPHYHGNECRALR